MKPQIENVSDTALWVAAHRANESKRPDALFQDPLAEVLAGERGAEIAKFMPQSQTLAWVMAVRTVAIDRLILEAIKEYGPDTIMNLGAGLDTRPYRMSLPSDLHWIEVDFPNIIDLKNEKLKREKPVCKLERVALDLSNLKARRAFFGQESLKQRKILVITEGVIPYLSNDAAALLGRDLASFDNIQFWIQDFRNGGAKSWAKKMKASPFLFNSEDQIGVFAKEGWERKEEDTIYMITAAYSLGRPFPFVFPRSLLSWTFHFMPKKKREKLLKASGYVLLQKT